MLLHEVSFDEGVGLPHNYQKQKEEHLDDTEEENIDDTDVLSKLEDNCFLTYKSCIMELVALIPTKHEHCHNSTKDNRTYIEMGE